MQAPRHSDKAGLSLWCPCPGCRPPQPPPPPPAPVAMPLTFNCEFEGGNFAEARCLVEGQVGCLCSPALQGQPMMSGSDTIPDYGKAPSCVCTASWKTTGQPCQTREIMKWTYIKAVCHRPMGVDPLAWLAWHTMPAGLSGWTICSAARLCLAGGCFPKGKARG